MKLIGTFTEYPTGVLVSKSTLLWEDEVEVEETQESIDAGKCELESRFQDYTKSSLHIAPLLESDIDIEHEGLGTAYKQFNPVYAKALTGQNLRHLGRYGVFNIRHNLSVYESADLYSKLSS